MTQIERIAAIAVMLADRAAQVRANGTFTDDDVERDLPLMDRLLLEASRLTPGAKSILITCYRKWSNGPGNLEPESHSGVVQ